MLSRPIDFMECALSLAGLALGYTSPNPAVGAVVVSDGVVVGLGHTQPPGLQELRRLREPGRGVSDQFDRGDVRGCRQRRVAVVRTTQGRRR